ncbi:MAG: Gfo/Idh/MocA family oxidoreductase [Pirellulales bacterium]
MSHLRLGVIGAGHLGRIHARLAAQLPGATLVGVADPDPTARAQVAEQLGVAVTPDYRALADQIDAAIVAAPTTLHHDIAIELAARKIHLLVEKPLASDARQAAAIVRAAARSNIVLQVGHVERFNPALAVAQPHVSEPKYIDAVRCGGYTFRSTDVGVVLDLMIHDLDIVLSLVRSPVRRVQALGLAVLGPHEDVAQARLEFDNGCVANLAASRVSYAGRREMQVWTPQGFASIDFAAKSTTLVSAAEPIVEREFDQRQLSPAEKEHLKSHLFEEVLPQRTAAGIDRNALADEQQDFVDSIRHGRAPRVSGEQAAKTIALAERVLESIARHQWDGHAAGRLGAMAIPATPILRAPLWTGHPLPSDAQREAG